MTTEDNEITAVELKERLDRGDSLELVDVREPHEWEIGNLGRQGAKLIPLNDLPNRVDEIARAGEVVVYCRSGARSARAANFLRDQGFENVLNLDGGILAWSEEVDPSIPKY